MKHLNILTELKVPQASSLNETNELQTTGLKSFSMEKKASRDACGTLKSIEKLYRTLSDTKHPVPIAMEKMKTVLAVRIIEGLPAFSKK
jgi:hypothetical protein